MFKSYISLMGFSEFSGIFCDFWVILRISTIIIFVPPKLTFYRWAPTRLWSVPKHQPHQKNKIWLGARPNWSSYDQVISFWRFTTKSGTHDVDFSQTTSESTSDSTMLISTKNWSIFIYNLQSTGLERERPQTEYFNIILMGRFATFYRWSPNGSRC